MLLRPPQLCSCGLNPVVVLLCSTRKVGGLDQRLKNDQSSARGHIPSFASRLKFLPSCVGSCRTRIDAAEAGRPPQVSAVVRGLRGARATAVESVGGALHDARADAARGGGSFGARAGTGEAGRAYKVSAGARVPSTIIIYVIMMTVGRVY